jgi:hypothetical protein
VATPALVKRLRLAMRIWVIGGLALILGSVPPLIVGVGITPIGGALIGLFAIQSVIACVAAAAFSKYLAHGSERHVGRGLVALGVWLVLAAVATVAFTFDLGAPNIEELQ